MKRFTNIIQKAKTSKLHLRLLNLGIKQMIPFNKPHGFKVLEIGDNHLLTYAPYKKSNFNHIKGIHACALATLSELTTGLLLMSRLDSASYRIIMQSFQVEYLYQAKKSVTAHYEISDEWLNAEVITPLQTQDSVTIPCPVEIKDEDGNVITKAVINWQIKAWSKVRTKVA